MPSDPAHTVLPPRRTRNAIIAALLATMAAVVIAGALSAPGSSPAIAPSAVSPGAAAVDAQVTLGPGPPVAVPPSFLGISTEYYSIPVWARRTGVLRRVFAALSQGGSIRLRIGGDSADRVQWAPKKELPEWVIELAPTWLRQTSRIVDQTHARLILDLNLVTSTPARAARWARTALAGLPRGSVTDFEIGNEPDVYKRHTWRLLIAGPSASRLPRRITAASYARSFASYATALARAAHGVPLLAPALAIPGRNYGWVSTLLRAPHPGLAGITAHRYSYSGCAKPGTRGFPTITRVLSEHATSSMARTALTIEHISDRAGLPLWLTEINSVTCGGVKGVSTSFATALWAPDALLELVRAGVESASVHVRTDTINKAFAITPRGLVAHPLLYGMILFERMLGPGARLIPLHLAASAALHLKSWAVALSGGGVHVLLVDKGRRSVRVRLNLPLVGPASIERLTAPRITSTRNVRLGNQHLTRLGTWAGAPRIETISPSAHGYVVNVPGYSAAVLTAQLRPGVMP